MSTLSVITSSIQDQLPSQLQGQLPGMASEKPGGGNDSNKNKNNPPPPSSSGGGGGGSGGQEGEGDGDKLQQGLQGLKKPATKEKLMQEITKRIEESRGFQEESMALHRRAEEATDPQVAEDLKFQARELDKKATRLLKTAKRLEQGWLQGGAAGAGIGAGVAGGLGMTIGTLVTGLVAIPTTGLGLLVGAGTGLVHGPWVKFTEVFTKDEVDEIDDDAEKEAKKIAEG